MMTYTKNTGCSYTQSRLPKGFTLIELLVVVLIIGILAAVALPQYQKAVLKSRFAGVVSNASAIARSLEIYYLANGTYPTSLEDIDMEISGCTTSATYISCAGEIYYYYHLDYNSGKTSTFISGFLKNKLGLAYLHYTQNNTQYPDRASKQWCWADSGNGTANQLCQAMRGTPDGTEDWHGEYTKSWLWNMYKLP